MRKEVASVEDVFALGLGVDAGGDHGLPVVVNCSGRGFGDEKMFVTRGKPLHFAIPPRAGGRPGRRPGMPCFLGMSYSMPS